MPLVPDSEVVPGPTFAQGVRCGHIDGQSRCGVYVRGEEALHSSEAASAQGLDWSASKQWEAGYEYGYRLGASGEPLQVEYQHAVERKPKSWA